MPLGPLRVKTILVVEDDSETRTLYRHTLANAGYAVIAVEDGTDALRHVEYARVDGVVLDLLLPRLGGFDVYKELRATPATRHLPVVVVTGSDVRELEVSRFRYFLRKPVDPEALVAAVDSAVRSAVGHAGA